jgi:hypothetical protein
VNRTPALHIGASSATVAFTETKFNPTMKTSAPNADSVTRSGTASWAGTAFTELPFRVPPCPRRMGTAADYTLRFLWVGLSLDCRRRPTLD